MLKLPFSHRREQPKLLSHFFFFFLLESKSAIFNKQQRIKAATGFIPWLFLVCLKGFFRLSFSCINACLSIMTQLKRNPRINHYSSKNKQTKKLSSILTCQELLWSVFSGRRTERRSSRSRWRRCRCRRASWGTHQSRFLRDTSRCPWRPLPEEKRGRVQNTKGWKIYQLLSQRRVFFFLLWRKNKPKGIFCKNKRSVLPQSHLRLWCKKLLVLFLIVREMFKTKR